MPTEIPRMKAMVRSLAHRNFRLFFVGQGISLLGSWMQLIALSWLLYRMTGSPFMLGLAGFAGSIPMCSFWPRWRES